MPRDVHLCGGRRYESARCAYAKGTGENLSKGQPMIPFVMMTDNRGQRISVNPEIVQFVRTADNADNECLIVFGKDQLLRVRGTLDEVTDLLRQG